jgi:NAD-dependent SIR2 family protein deacetylase
MRACPTVFFQTKCLAKNITLMILYAMTVMSIWPLLSKNKKSSIHSQATIAMTNTITNNNTDFQAAYRAAAKHLATADALIITAGAGMGIDSGLPDFRGDEGFWQAYPALGQLGIPFTDIANPASFTATPRLAWGFYGHRLALYRSTVPHAGFGQLLDLSRKLTHGAFVFTSNVDGQFQKAGFAPERLMACHGSIHHLQCSADSSHGIWPADDFHPEVDEAQCQLLSEPPACPVCGAMARPNILMFGDDKWNTSHAEQQREHLLAWLQHVKRPVVIEIGAGTAIPSVRRFGENLGSPLIRINPREPDVALEKGVALPVGALEGITGILQALAQLP